MSTDTTSPYSRENFWGDLEDDSEDRPSGHSEVVGTDPAEYVAFQFLRVATDRALCKRSLRQWGTAIDLTEPEIRMPKERDHGTHIEEFGVFAYSYRANPETGWLTWDGETGVAVPEPDQQEYQNAVEWYLSQNDHCIDDESFARWQSWAQRLWHDPGMNGKEAFLTFVRRKRAYDDPENRDVTGIPDA